MAHSVSLDVTLATNNEREFRPTTMARRRKLGYVNLGRAVCSAPGRNN